MNNQTLYIWLQQGQNLWKQIQNFIIHNKDAITFIISFTTFIFGAGAIRSFLCSLVQQNRKRKLLPDTFPFEVIKPQSNALQMLMGGNENDPLADYKIPYQDRVPGRNTQDELKQKLDQHRWLLILAPTGWGKTREAANLADRLNNEGWTILKLKRGEWLEAPPILPEDKIGTDRKLLFFLDDLNNKMSGGRIEQSPKADDPLQPLNKPLQERLFNTLQAYEKLCRKEDIRIIATARNEKEREFPDEPSEWEKLEFDKYSFWKRFEIYNLPEPNEEAIVRVLKETIPQANIQANPDDYSRIAQRNDRTFRNIVENLRSTKNYDRFLTIDNFRDTLKGTWKERYQRAIKQYPVATYIYDAVELLRKMGIDLYPFTVEPTARMMIDGNLLRKIWDWWQIRKTLSYLIDVEGILEPRDGQIEAKGKQVEVEEYISKLLNLLLKIAKQYPTEMLFSLIMFSSQASKFKHFKEALDGIVKAQNIEPNSHMVWFIHGNILHDLGNLEDAILSFDKAIKANDNDYWLWYNRGIVLYDMGYLDEAINSLNKSIELNPNLYKGWYCRGIVLGRLNRLDEAITSFDKVLEFEPNWYEAWKYRGITLIKLERFQEAIDSFDKVLKLEPEYADSFYNKARCYTCLKNLDQAIYNLQHAINLNPELCRESAINDSVFDNIRNEPRFQALLQE